MEALFVSTGVVALAEIGDKTKEGKGNFGYNAQTGEYVDMIEFGILDPTKVTRTALQNAVSIAGLMITTEAMVADHAISASQCGRSCTTKARRLPSLLTANRLMSPPRFFNWARGARPLPGLPLQRSKVSPLAISREPSGNQQ